MKYPIIFWDSGNTIFHSGNRPEGFGGYPSPAEVKKARGFRAKHSLEMFGHGAPTDLSQIMDELEGTLLSQHGEGYSLEMLARELYSHLGIVKREAELPLLADAIGGPRYRTWLWDGVADALATLHEAGVYMGIIADTVLTGRMMRGVMTAVGLGDYFGPVICSCDIGVAKPDSRIYEAALGAVPEAIRSSGAVLYVGDHIAKDIDGAKACGWDGALHLTTQQDTQSEAVLTFRDYGDLVRLVLEKK
jgi:HAD superfamily hydrolase (TIGR01549 family)